MAAARKPGPALRMTAGDKRSLERPLIAAVALAACALFEAASLAREAGRPHDWIEFEPPTLLRWDGGGARISPSRRVPHVVAVADAVGSGGPSSLFDKQLETMDRVDFSKDSLPLEGPLVAPDWYDPNADEFVDGYDWDVCVPMHDWQLRSFPNCNSFHELDLVAMRVVAEGGSRIAFALTRELNGKIQKFVYKTILFDGEIDMEHVDKQRKDALVMERTSKSQFIPDIHGYCGLGGMMDFMPEGNFHAYMKGARLAEGSTLSAVDKLKIAIHIATSVADLHTIDDTVIPSYFHNDICCHQFLFQNGVFKLNDFNHADAIYMNENTKEACTRSSFQMEMWKARSLEEHHNALVGPLAVTPDKVDVWMMGNIIYYTLTDLYTFEKPENLDCDESGWEILKGRRSPYPEHIEKSDDPSFVAMKKALDMCWTQDWKERPSARSISDYLWQQLREITGEEDPDVRIVLPERDPNQSNSDSEMEYYND